MQLHVACLLMAQLCASLSASYASNAEDSLDDVTDPSARLLLGRAFDEIESLRLEVESLRREQQRSDSRRLQRTSATSDQAREVRIYTRSMQRDRTDPGRGRRQAQTAGETGGCWTDGDDAGTIDVEGRTAEVHTACCARPGDDCSSGAPATCDAACASVLLRFWDDCETHLRVDKALWVTFHGVVQECQEAVVSRAGESLCVLPRSVHVNMERLAAGAD